MEHWLCETPLLITIYLEEAGVEILDLSKSHLDHLELDVTGVTTLKLPSSVEWLKIYELKNVKIKNLPCFLIWGSLGNEARENNELEKNYEIR